MPQTQQGWGGTLKAAKPMRTHVTSTTEPRGPLQVDRGYSQTWGLMMTPRGVGWMMRWEDWA